MKAIFEMEAPESCEVCKLSHLGLHPEHRYCITGDNVSARYDSESSRDPRCPLKIKSELSFGDYVLIEQKRYGAENEMYLHKVIGTSESNSWVDVPVQSTTETLHKVKELEPVVSCICCGVCETKVRKYRIKDVRRQK